MRSDRTEAMLRVGWLAQLLLLGLFFCGRTFVCHAQTAVSQAPAPSEQVLAKLRQRGTLILRDASLVEALFAIQENWGVNIVVGNDVKGAVNGAYNNAPLHEILDSILASQGYGYLAIGDSLVVMKLEYLGALKPLFVAETITVENVPPEEVAGVIAFLLSPHGKAHAVPSSKAIVVIDYPERIQVVKARVAELDRAARQTNQSRVATVPNSDRSKDAAPLQYATFVLQHADAEETARVIEVLLSPEGKVRAAASSHTLLVVDRAEQLELIRARIADLDAAAAAAKTSAQPELPAATEPAAPRSEPQGPPPSSDASRTSNAPSGPVAPEPLGTPAFPTPADTSPPLPNVSANTTSSTTLGATSGFRQGVGNGELTLPPEEFEVALFAPQYVRASTLVEALATLVGPYGQVSAIAEENRIVAIDQPPYIRRLVAAVEKLDVPRRQVRISALIFDASLTDLENIGINWSHSVKGRNLTSDGNPQDLFSINAVTLPSPGANAVHGALTFMSLSQHFDVTAVVNALRSSRNSRLLADPTVVVSDQESAKISIVTEIPYQQLTESALGGVIGTTAFREAGVTLEVTPHIARDATVNMIVTPRFSVLTGFTEQDNQPIIAKREAQTVVRVANNQTLVIGGLRQRGRVRERSAVPYLADIKFIGHLFRQRSDEIRESELLVFLTPTIIDPDTFGTARERMGYEAGKCELEQVRQEPCERCFPPEDPTLYRNRDFRAEQVPSAAGQNGPGQPQPVRPSDPQSPSDAGPSPTTWRREVQDSGIETIRLETRPLDNSRSTSDPALRSAQPTDMSHRSTPPTARLAAELPRPTPTPFSTPTDRQANAPGGSTKPMAAARTVLSQANTPRIVGSSLDTTELSARNPRRQSRQAVSDPGTNSDQNAGLPPKAETVPTQTHLDRFFRLQ